MKKRSGLNRIIHYEHFYLIVTLVVVFLLMAYLNGPKFLRWKNISSMLYQMPTIGLLAIGMMIAELTGGINYAIVAMANFSSIMIYVLLNAMTGGSMSTASPLLCVLAIVIDFIICAALGLLTGAIIAKLNIIPLLVTLGTMTLFQGISLLMTKGYTISGFPKFITFIGNGNVGGVPTSIILFAIVVIITYIILDKTVYGKQLYMTGANKIAAKYSNVDVDKVVIIQFMLSSLFSFFASLVMIGQMNSAKANYYESYVLIAVLASFLGGVNPNGGFGKLLGTVLAALILQVINTGLNLMRLDPFMVTAMWGAIIIVVLFGREIIGKISAAISKRKS